MLHRDRFGPGAVRIEIWRPAVQLTPDIGPPMQECRAPKRQAPLPPIGVAVPVLRQFIQSVGERLQRRGVAGFGGSRSHLFPP